MKIKNGRIIINEDYIERDLISLEKSLRNFFQTDKRFAGSDIGVFVEFDSDCWNEDLSHCWNEININIVNYDILTELGGQLAGEKRFAFSNITYTTDTLEPQFVLNNGEPEFYYIFNLGASCITNSVTWQNNRDAETVEDIVDYILTAWYEV